MFPTLTQLRSFRIKFQEDYFKGYRMGRHVNAVVTEKKNNAQKLSDYTFYVTAYCEKSKPENENLYT